MITPAELLQMQMRVSNATRRNRPELPDDAAEDESKLHADIIAYCRSRKWGMIHSRMDRRATATVGAPDFVILADGGRTFYIEAKRRNGKLSPGQLAFKVQAEFNGHKVHVVQSIEEVIQIIA